MHFFQNIFGLAGLALFTLQASAQQPANNPGTCDADDGKYRTTTVGTTLKIVCNKSAGADILQRGMRPTFGACIDACAITAGCKGVDYTPSTKGCIFLSAPTKGTKPTPGTHNAYLEDDPSKQQTPPPNTNPGTGSPPPSTGGTPPNTGGTPPPTSGTPSQGGPAQAAGPGPTDPKIEVTTNPRCPEGDGKAFIGDDGTYYKLQCGFHTVGNQLGTFQGVGTFAECMNKCSATNGCLSVQYIAPPGAAGYTNYECVLSDGEGPGTTTCAHWFAYTIDPPATAEDKPFPHMLCETTCPLSDGMIYESEAGENFKMSCGKRHGTKILWTANMETFQDCMDSCGKILACHSVDYQARNKKCYYGSHHGEPTLPAPGFSSATTMGCAGACKKSSCCSKEAKEL